MIITEPKDVIALYVSRQLGMPPPTGPYAAIGQVNADGELLAGAMFNGYTPPNVLMHVAAENMSPAFIAAALGYAFNQLKCSRITGLIDANNTKSRRFAEHLGAELEGIMREASPSGDVCVYGLLRRDALKWIAPRYMKKLEGAYGQLF